MLKILTAAAVLSLAAAYPAAAAPRPSTLPLAAVSSDLVEVQYRYDRRHYRRDRYDRRHYRPGHRYRSAPPHWRRYYARPLDWQRRGCAQFGPLWFCP